VGARLRETNVLIVFPRDSLRALSTLFGPCQVYISLNELLTIKERSADQPNVDWELASDPIGFCQKHVLRLCVVKWQNLLSDKG